jgi:hypothetical protein
MVAGLDHALADVRWAMGIVGWRQPKVRESAGLDG